MNELHSLEVEVLRVAGSKSLGSQMFVTDALLRWLQLAKTPHCSAEARHTHTFATKHENSISLTVTGAAL